MNKYFVIFGGGGIRGVSYCGAYKALIEGNIEISAMAGSSIGAVFATLLSLKYTYEEIFEVFLNTGFELFIDFNFDLKKEIAFSKGQIFYDWIKNLIEQKFYKESYKKNSMPPVKFSDLDKNLVIYAVDLVNFKFKEFSKAKTPDYEIARAVRASVSMPGLFTPLEEDGSLLVDGDLLKACPLWRLSDAIKNSKDRILEFRLEDNENEEKHLNPIDYLNRVYNAISGFATDYIIDLYSQKDKFDYIKINTPNVSVVNFLISKEKKSELFEIGYNTTKLYFSETLKNKKSRLEEKYGKILSQFLKFQKTFLKKDYLNSYITLCESFVYICEEKQYIDKTIFDLISNFKDLYFKNYSRVEFLFYKKANLKADKEEISKELLEIIKTLTLKVRELKNY